MAVPQNYRLFKFRNGEDVIAEWIEHPHDKNHLILHRPMQIQVMMKLDRNGNPVPAKLVMTEWLAFSKEDTAIVPRESIMCWGKPTPLIAGVYNKEKLRIDKMRANADMQTPPPNELEKTKEQIIAEKKLRKRRNRKNKVILIQLTLETLLKFLASLGLDADDEPWKSMINPTNSEDEDEDEEDNEDEEEDEDAEKPQNLDGSMDIMPDIDGDGFVDPFGNPWSGSGPSSG